MGDPSGLAEGSPKDSGMLLGLVMKQNLLGSVPSVIVRYFFAPVFELKYRGPVTNRVRGRAFGIKQL